MTFHAAPLLYRERPGKDWVEVELIGRVSSSQWLVREVGPFWPGVVSAGLDQLREAGPVIELSA